LIPHQKTNSIQKLKLLDEVLFILFSN
jgi:hypothetical protein